MGDRPQASGDCRLVARGCRRPGGTRRLGLCTGVRFSTCVRRVSYSEYPGALPMKRLCLWAWCVAAMAIVHAAEGDSMNLLAERYVKLVLAFGQHDADYV